MHGPAVQIFFQFYTAFVHQVKTPNDICKEDMKKINRSFTELLKNFLRKYFYLQKVVDDMTHSISQRSKNAMKMAFENSDFSFLYSIKILTFVNSKSSTLKNGAKWLNIKTKF